MLAEMDANSFAVLSRSVKPNSSLNDASEIDVPMNAESYLTTMQCSHVSQLREFRSLRLSWRGEIFLKRERISNAPDHDGGSRCHDRTRVDSPVVDRFGRRPILLSSKKFDHSVGFGGLERRGLRCSTAVAGEMRTLCRCSETVELWVDWVEREEVKVEKEGEGERGGVDPVKNFQRTRQPRERSK